MPEYLKPAIDGSRVARCQSAVVYGRVLRQVFRCSRKTGPSSKKRPTVSGWSFPHPAEILIGLTSTGMRSVNLRVTVPPAVCAGETLGGQAHSLGEVPGRVERKCLRERAGDWHAERELRAACSLPRVDA